MFRKLALLAITLLVLEGLARLVMGGAEIGRLYEVRWHDPARCIGLRPGASVEYTGWLFRVPAVLHEVNDLGYRGRERPPARARGTFRIAAIGDSFVYGLGVRSEDSIPARLESALGSGVEVLNFGIPAAQLDNAVAQLGDFAATWRPDLALYFLYTDDLEPSLCAWTHFPGVVVGLGSRASYLFRLGHIGFNLGGLWLRALRTENPGRVERFRAGMRALVQASARAGAPLAVVVLGDPIRPSGSAALGAVMEELHVRWLDAREWLGARDAARPPASGGNTDERLPVIPGELHFTAAGNAQAAGRVARWLVSDGLIPSR
jgi:hypothetical protein